MGDLDLQDLANGLIYLGYLAAAMTAIGIVLRFAVVRPLQKWLREQIKPQLAEVHAEVTPNHGSSMKDALTRIEDEQTALARRFTDHLMNHPGASL